MADRGRLGRSREGDERGRSPSRSGDRGQSPRERSRSRERGDRAESSYTHGRQEVSQQSENIVQHLWMTEEKPNTGELESTIREMTTEEIKEVISSINLENLYKKGLSSLAHTHPEAKHDSGFEQGETDVGSLRAIKDHDGFAAKLHSMLQGGDRRPGWASDQVAVEIIGKAIRQKWKEHH